MKHRNVSSLTRLTVYARREPTSDTVARANGLSHKLDTVFYRDGSCEQFLARKPWYQSGHPRKNSKEVMLDGYRWALQWASQGN